MADDPSTIAWRLQRLEEAIRDLGLRVVSVDLYTRDRAEIERDLAELRTAIAEEKLARKEADRDEVKAREEADRDLRNAADKQGASWRQALYSGLIPGAIFLLGLLWQLRAGTGK